MQVKRKRREIKLEKVYRRREKEFSLSIFLCFVCVNKCDTIPSIYKGILTLFDK